MKIKTLHAALVEDGIHACRFTCAEWEECEPSSWKVLLLRTKCYTCMKTNNLDRPYEHIRLTTATDIFFTLEFDTIQTLIQNITEVLSINRNPKIYQRDEELKVLSSNLTIRALKNLSRFL